MRKSRRIASFRMLSNSKSEDVSQNCFVLALLCSNGCGKMHRHGCTQESISDYNHVRKLILKNIAAIIQRKFSSKTAELPTDVQGQSCHHVHHIVSKDRSRLGAVEERNGPGACEFTGENAFAPSFFRAMWLLGLPK